MFVTAFLQPNTSYRSTDVYFAQFQHLVETNIPILLFLDTKFCDKSFPSNVQVIPTSLEWMPKTFQLPSNRNPNKDTLEYFCIQLSKLFYLQEATKYTNDTYLAWIDFGVFHMFQNHEQCKRILKTISTSTFPDTTILAPGCWPKGSYDWNSVCWRFCGSFLLGHRSLFAPAYAKQMELVQSQLPRLTWEVNLWAQMEEHFTVYLADHNDSLLSNVIMFVQRHQGVST